eukprot:4497300-Pyramimonas_sp.AAC.1
MEQTGAGTASPLKDSDASDERARSIKEIVALYAGIDDPALHMSLAWFNKQEMCQVVAQLAAVDGHGWIPCSGEGLAAMVRPGRPLRDFFRPLAQTSTKGYKFWGGVIHAVSESICQFSDSQDKRLGGSASPQWFMQDCHQGTDADI